MLSVVLVVAQKGVVQNLEGNLVNSESNLHVFVPYEATTGNLSVLPFFTSTESNSTCGVVVLANYRAVAIVVAAVHHHAS